MPTPGLPCDLTPGLPCDLTPGLPCDLTPGLPCDLTPGLPYDLTPDLPCSNVSSHLAYPRVLLGPKQHRMYPESRLEQP
jgi:hypothetical protein